MPLYDMQSQSSASLQDILQSSRKAKKLMMVTSISTGRVSRVQEDPKYLELWISFYPGGNTRQDDEISLPNWM
jgi:hypothetical protein